MPQGVSLHRFYTASIAADVLGLDVSVISKRAQRGAIAALRPRSGPNPLRDWLFDADEIDRQAGRTSSSSIWIERLGGPSLQPIDGVGLDMREVQRGEWLSGEYREQIDLLKVEVAVERESRLIAERHAAENERDAARRELDRLQRAFRALTTALTDDSSL